MSWSSLDPAFRKLASEELTARQLDIFRLRFDGASWRTIALALEISDSTARSTHDRAAQKLALLVKEKV